MHRFDSRTNNQQHMAKYLALQPRVHSRQYNKSKSNKKNHINRNIIAPCEPLGDKLLKAVIEKNQRKSAQNKRQKTEQSFLQGSTMAQPSRCHNHPQKKGEYFIESQPNKKFCLKCSLTLNNGSPSPFVTNQKQHKKQTLDTFKQQLIQLKNQLQTTTQQLHTSIEQSQEKFSQHSAYINESFVVARQQLDEKRRQLMNSLIIAQQNLKKVYEQNLKRVKKMSRSVEKYEFDISKFYDEIIEELPRDEFDHIMREYEDKINRNFRAKLKGILCQEGVCVYVPNLELKTVIQKASVEFYQPVTDRERDRDDDTKKNQNASFYGYRQSNEPKKNGSNSLDSKLNDYSYENSKMPITGFVVPQRKREVNLTLFQRKTGNFVSPRKDDQQRHQLIEDKENINLQNFAYDYYNPKPDNLSKFTFKV